MTTEKPELPDECKQTFEKFLREKSLDNAKEKDVWGIEGYKHSHISAMYYAWQGAWKVLVTRPADERSEDSLPKFSDLYGMAPNATKGVPAEDFIAGIRDRPEVREALDQAIRLVEAIGVNNCVQLTDEINKWLPRWKAALTRPEPQASIEELKKDLPCDCENKHGRCNENAYYYGWNDAIDDMAAKGLLRVRGD